MMKMISIASGVLVLGAISTGAFAQGFLPDVFGGNGAAAVHGPVKAPGNNRYQPYLTSAPVYTSGQASATTGNWAHNRYNRAADASVLGDAIYASGAYSSAARASDGVHNRYTN